MVHVGNHGDVANGMYRLHILNISF